MIPSTAITANAILAATADEYGVTVDEIFGPWWRPPEVQAARTKAIQRLANEMVDDRFRFPLRDICEWFGISRTQVAKYRAKSDHVKRYPVG